MKKHELMFVVCRILAVYIFIQAFMQLESIIMLISRFSPEEKHYLLVSIIWFLSFCVAGIIFWRKASWFSAKIVSSSDNDNVFSNITAENLFNVAITTIGLCLLVKSTPRFVGALIQFLYFKGAFIESRWSITNNFWFKNLSDFIELIIGMFMTFGPNMISGFIREIRRPKG